MLFSGIPFLYYFLPVVLILYFVVPQKAKNIILLISSIIFYAWGEPRCVILMIASIIIGYFFAYKIEATNNLKAKKLLLVIAIILLLGFLVYYKYANFFINNFNAITGMSVPLLNIVLPIGISFYTFQIVSYVIDVYRKDVNAQKNIINLAMYITMFPQLIAGPIVRYKNIVKDLEYRTHSFENFALGTRRFVIGLSKKVLLANVLGELCDIFKTSQDKSVLFYWIYIIALCLHIYFDFSGYSDMAIGLGKIFGFHFCENFNYPFISKSITEFWRRWHISLGTWFRDYVYIPMGGNRVSKIRFFFNIFVVWMLTGFWHGASWNFIIWGIFFAIFLYIEKIFLLEKVKKHNVISRVYTLLIVAISFTIFDATDITVAYQYIKHMFGIGDIPIISKECIYYTRSYSIPLFIGIIGSTPLVKTISNKINEKVRNILEPIVLIILMLIITAYLVDGSFNPFLYFRF